MSDYIVNIEIDSEDAFLNMRPNVQRQFIDQYIDCASDDALIEELKKSWLSINGRLNL